MAAYCRVYDSRTCRLTAKNWGQLRNSALGNEIWVTFSFFTVTTAKLGCLVLNTYSNRTVYAEVCELQFSSVQFRSCAMNWLRIFFCVQSVDCFVIAGNVLAVMMHCPLYKVI